MNRLIKHFTHSFLLVAFSLIATFNFIPLQSLHAAPPAAISLQQATDKAVKKFGGEVIKTETINQNGSTVYVIRLLSNGRIKDVLIDSTNGSVKNPIKE
ncbi:MAG: PepSY domain-containing protein [Neptuniibacter sp.]